MFSHVTEISMLNPCRLSQWNSTMISIDQKQWGTRPREDWGAFLCDDESGQQWTTNLKARRVGWVYSASLGQWPILSKKSSTSERGDDASCQYRSLFAYGHEFAHGFEEERAISQIDHIQGESNLWLIPWTNGWMSERTAVIPPDSLSLSTQDCVWDVVVAANAGRQYDHFGIRFGAVVSVFWRSEKSKQLLQNLLLG